MSENLHRRSLSTWPSCGWRDWSAPGGCARPSSTVWTTTTSDNWSPTPSSTPNTPDPACPATTVTLPNLRRRTRQQRRRPRMTHENREVTADHGHHHSHERGHGHSHDVRGGKLGAALREVFAPHSHDASDSIDGALESSAA